MTAQAATSNQVNDDDTVVSTDVTQAMNGALSRFPLRFMIPRRAFSACKLSLKLMVKSKKHEEDGSPITDR